MKKNILIGIIAIIGFGCSTTSVRIHNYRKVAVLDTGSEETHEADDKLTSKIISRLANRRYYKVVERERIKRLLDERQYSALKSGNENTVTDTGKILGVDAIIFTGIDSYGVQQYEGEKLVKEKLVEETRTSSSSSSTRETYKNDYDKSDNSVHKYYYGRGRDYEEKPGSPAAKKENNKPKKESEKKIREDIKKEVEKIRKLKEREEERKKAQKEKEIKDKKETKKADKEIVKDNKISQKEEEKSDKKDKKKEEKKTEEKEKEEEKVADKEAKKVKKEEKKKEKIADKETKKIDKKEKKEEKVADKEAKEIESEEERRIKEEEKERKEAEKELERLQKKLQKVTEKEEKEARKKEKKDKPKKSKGLFSVNSFVKEIKDNKAETKEEKKSKKKPAEKEIQSGSASETSVTTKEVLLSKKEIAKKGYVSGNIRMVDVVTGEVVKAVSNNKSAVIVATTTEQAMNMPSDERILDVLTSNLANTFSYSVSPHRIGEARILHKGDDDLTKRGVKYAKKGLWREAKDAWETALDINSSNAYAYNNLGVVMEKNRDTEGAIENYRKALALIPDEDVFIKNLSRARSKLNSEIR